MGGHRGLDDARFLLYLPRLVATWPDQSTVQVIEATVVFADVTGFTALTERLSAEGSIGSEQVTEHVNAVFSEILSVARLEGGDLLSFGGDAVLLLFAGEDHRRRALTAAMEMQEAIADDVTLGASIGAASGKVTVVLAGNRQRMVFVVGAVVDEVVAAESSAGAGEVVATGATLDGVEDTCRGEERHGGFVVAASPEPSNVELLDAPGDSTQDLSRFVPVSLHSELAVTGADGEHRPAVVAFLRFRGTTSLWDRERSAEQLTALVDDLVEQADQHRVSVLGADIDDDGLKLIVTAGVPVAVAEPHERLLRTLRRFMDGAPDLDVRVGVADGDVFAGDLGAAFRRAYTVIGDPVNTAARLAGVAERGEIVSTPEVASRVSRRFATHPGEAVALKGKAEEIVPVLIGHALTHTDGVAVQPEFLGRTAEMAELVRSYRESLDGDRRVVEIVGPGGIGKTRLVRRFLTEAHATSSIEVAAREYDRASPYRVMSSLVRSSMGIPLEATAEEAGLRLEDLVAARSPESLPWLPLLAVAAEATVAPTIEVDDLDPRFVSASTAKALVDLAYTLVDDPVIVVVEDGEWVDSASRALLEGMIELTTHRRWMWVFTGRTGADWPGATVIELGPLDPDDTRQLVSSTGVDLPPHVVEHLAARADGNPFFAVELATLGMSDTVPDTIERLIATRIDRLGARERRLLRYAAVLGTEFDLDLFAEALAPVAGGLDDSGAWASVDEFLTVSSLGKVRFRQGIVRDVAYAGLSYRRRTEIHGLVATTIERRGRHRARRFAAPLALHFEAAGDAAKTWEYGVAAGERAAATWANREAVAHYRRALVAAERIEGVDAREVFDAAMAMSEVADVAGDFSGADFALAVAGRHVSVLDRLRLSVGRAKLLEKRGDLEVAARTLEAEAPTTANRVGLEAINMLAGVRYRQGMFEECASLAQSVVDAHDIDEHPDLLAHALRLLSVAQTHLRLPGRRANAERSVAMFESIGRWSEVGKAYNNLAIESYYRGDWVEAARCYAAGREASERAGDVVMVATFDNNLGEIRSDQGGWEEARILFDRARSTWLAAEYAVGSTLVLSNLGRLDVRTGELERGLDRLTRARDGFEAIGAAALTYETEIRIAEALIACGECSEAMEMIDRLDEASDERDGILERLRGHAWAVLGDRGKAGTAFSRALPLLEAAEFRFELGLATRAVALLDDLASHGGAEILAELGAEGAHMLPLG